MSVCSIESAVILVTSCEPTNLKLYLCMALTLRLLSGVFCLTLLRVRALRRRLDGPHGRALGLGHRQGLQPPRIRDVLGYHDLVHGVDERRGLLLEVECALRYASIVFNPLTIRLRQRRRLEVAPKKTSLNQLVTPRHILARVDRVLDLAWLREEVADCYCADNRGPGIDSEVAVCYRRIAAFRLSSVLSRREPPLHWKPPSFVNTSWKCLILDNLDKYDSLTISKYPS